MPPPPPGKADAAAPSAQGLAETLPVELRATASAPAEAASETALKLSMPEEIDTALPLPAPGLAGDAKQPIGAAKPAAIQGGAPAASGRTGRSHLDDRGTLSQPGQSSVSAAIPVQSQPAVPSPAVGVTVGGAPPPPLPPLSHVADGAGQASAASSPLTTPTPPAAQLSQAVAALHLKPDGSSQLTIKLDPAELGEVQVQILRAGNGAASITVAVERLETLRALQADVTHLHLALDRAGVPEQQRSLVLHLSPAPPHGGSGNDSALPGGFSGGSQGGYQDGGRRHAPGWSPGAGGGAQDFTAVFPLDETPSRSFRSQAGINITA